MSGRSANGVDVALPEAFVARQAALLGPDAGSFLTSLSQPPVRALRVNERKATLVKVAERLALTVDPVPWCPTATYLPPSARPGDSVEHRAGLFYLQEPSSMAVVEALDIRPDHFVLDIAAAPGGKATHAASRLGMDGLLMANEVVSGRLGPLLANLDGWGYANTAVASTRASRLAEFYPAFFDRIIVDAPCTGEALFRRDPASRAQWSEAQVRGAARRQSKLLASAAQTAAPGALLAYSTCTFGPAENEEQIARFLDEHTAWEPVDISSLPGSDHGRFIGVGAGHGKALQFLPHECRCEGQFVSVLRAPGESRDRRPPATGRRKQSQPPHPAWAAFATETLRNGFDPALVLLRGDTFFLQPPALQEPAPLLRPGLQLGRLVGKTFRPAHALAMALDRDAVLAAEPLDKDELSQVRSGQTVSRPGPPGWVLVVLEAWPIGWAQRKNNVLTPRLPAHARQRG